MTKKQRSIVLLLIVLLVGSIAIVGSGWLYIYNVVKAFDEVYAHHVYVEDIPIGGMTKQEAKEHIEEQLRQDNQKIMYTLSYKDKKQTLTQEELRPTYPLDDVLEKAYEEGHNEPFIERYKLAKHGGRAKVNLELTPIFTVAHIEQSLEPHKDVFYVAPIDATIERKNRAFKITPEVDGSTLDIKKTAEFIYNGLATKPEAPKSYEVIVSKVPATMTQQQLELVQTPVSSFTTSFNNADGYRNKNLEIAANKISRVLKPGEVFSLGEQLEPITAEAGYQPSKMILNGELVDSVGGGICQVASTLYNAVLLSELDIVTRANHSLPVAYVPLGRDATYATDSIDFRFQNNSQYPVFIESYCENNKVYVTLFSHSSLKHPYDSIKFSSETIETIKAPETKVIKDPNLYEDQRIQETRPLEGKTVKLYKLCYNGGELVHKELVNTSYYRARAEVVKVGTKPRPAKEVKEEKLEETFMESLDDSFLTP